MNESYWIKAKKEVKHYPAIEKEMDANIVIIGGGLCGLTSAYYLSHIEDDIMVIEADRIGSGASGRNTGKITCQHGLLYKDLIAHHGIEKASQYYKANNEAIDSIARIVKSAQIDCAFERCDSLMYTNDPAKIQDYKDEYQAYLDLEIPCTYVENTPYPFPIEAGLIMHQQAKYDPYAYLLGLTKLIEQANISIFEESPVTEMVKEEDGTYTLLLKNRQKVHANKVILATQFPIFDHGHFYFARMYCEQSTILYTPYKSDQQMMAICTDEIMHSYSTMKDDLLIGGNNYKSGQHKDAYLDQMKDDAIKLFKLQDTPTHWSSSDYISFDHIPLIGKLDKHDDRVLFASGFSKWGNTTSNVAAKLLCAHILLYRIPYRSLFSPQRYVNIFSAPFVKENLNVAYEYIKGKLKPEDNEYPHKKEAKRMQIDGHLYGVYRDEKDDLFIVDITCPHLGCICNFNAVDKTWDCPCHGSRFSYTGEVIKGPATKRLHPYSEGLNTIDPHIIE